MEEVARSLVALCAWLFLHCEAQTEGFGFGPKFRLSWVHQLSASRKGYLGQMQSVPEELLCGAI